MAAALGFDVCSALPRYLVCMCYLDRSRKAQVASTAADIS